MGNVSATKKLFSKINTVDVDMSMRVQNQDCRKKNSHLCFLCSNQNCSEFVRKEKIMGFYSKYWWSRCLRSKNKFIFFDDIFY